MTTVIIGLGAAGLGAVRRDLARHGLNQRNGLSLRGHYGAKASRGDAGSGVARHGRVWLGKGGNPHGVISVSGDNLKATSTEAVFKFNNAKQRASHSANRHTQRN